MLCTTLSQSLILSVYFMLLWRFVDGSSWSSTWQHLELAKGKAGGHTCEGLFLIKSFEVERTSLLLDPLRWEDAASVWPQLLVAACLRTWKKCLLSPCHCSHWEQGIPCFFIPTSLGFCHILRTSWGIQHQGWSSYWILGLSIGRQPSLDWLDHSLWAILTNPPSYIQIHFTTNI